MISATNSSRSLVHHALALLTLLIIAGCGREKARTATRFVVRDIQSPAATVTRETRVVRGGRPGGVGDCEAILRRESSRLDREVCASASGALDFAPYDLVLTDGRTVSAERARLRVPERRTASSGKIIEVAVIRLRSTSGTSSTPIVFLPGNPGGASGSQTLRVASLYAFFEKLRGVGDVIVMDYRGSGLSAPRLDCPPHQYTANAFATRDNALRLMLGSSEACAKSLEEKGIDVLGYTWDEVAEDIGDLRRGLNVPRIALVAFSSGTHASFAFLRRHEHEVERMILVGTEGPDHTRKLPSNMDRQLESIASLVRGDSALRARIPDFRALMRGVLAQLDSNPARVDVALPGSTQRERAVIGRFGMEYTTATNLAGPEEFSFLPLLYYTLSRGDVSVLTRIIQRAVERRPPNALMYLLDGASGVSPKRAQRIAKEEDASILGDAANFPFPEIRRAWAYNDLGQQYRSPLRTSVPALFATGELDGNTPPHQAEEIRKGFVRSTRLIVARGGHGSPLTTPAAVDLMCVFLQGGVARDTTVDGPPVRFARLTP